VTAATHGAVTDHLDTDRGLFVYGVVPADARVPDGLTGVEEAPVRTVVRGPVAAVVGEVDLSRTTGRRADLVAYSTVLDALASTCAVAPVQFGSVLVDEQSVGEDLLAPDEDYFVALLEELAGRTQLNLRASFVEAVVLAEVVSADPEIRRLRELTRDLPEEAAYADRVRLGELVAAAVEDKRIMEVEALLDSILPFTAAYSLRPAGGGLEHLLDVALLVDDERRTELEDHLEGLAEVVHERIRLRLVGPVAPYDFVGRDAWV
jgi:hypothetical protein